MSHAPAPQVPGTVLVAEDDPDHAFLLLHAFEEAGAPFAVHHVDTGDRVLAFLRREHPYEDAPRPDLILLDVHMPRMSGHEVMQALHGDADLRRIPVIVMSTSSSPEEVRGLRELGCRSYVTKTVDFCAFAAGIWQLAQDCLAEDALQPP